MSKGKLQKFAEMETFCNVYQFPYSALKDSEFAMRGRWRDDCFCNQNPIVLELGCGKGEYTVGLAKLYPEVNFIGVDIKGARMHTGAKQALEEGLKNVAFLRTNIEIIDRFFADGGLVHLKTDSNFLFTYTTCMVERNRLPLLFRTEDLYHTDGIDDETRKILSIQTYYEAQWIERGLNIRYMKYRLPHGGALEEPDVEIPLDDYRSFKRTKRSSLETSK